MGAHTFLVQAGHWIAEGEFTDAELVIVAMKGESVITHDGPTLTIRSTMGSFTNDYVVEPQAEDPLTMHWRSRNGALGELRGTFTIVDDTILSAFANVEGSVRGYESLRQLSDDAYENRGVLFSDGRRVSSWSMQLRRIG